MSVWDKGKHTVFHHRYQNSLDYKYRYKILTRTINEIIQTIVAKVSAEMEVKVENGVSSNHLHLFVVIPASHVAVSDFVRRTKGRGVFVQSSTRISRAKENIMGKVFCEQDTLLSGTSAQHIIDVADDIIAQETNVNAKDRWRISIYIYILNKIHLYVVSAILKEGAGVDTENWYKKTPLHFAAESGNQELAKPLLVNREPYPCLQPMMAITILYS